MLIRWRNGVLYVGYLAYSDAWGIELAWNRREDLNDPPAEGEVDFADYKCLWWSRRGRWWPRYSSYAINLMT